MLYEDFVVQIGRDLGQGHRVRVLKSPAGEGEGLFRVPPGSERLSMILGSAREGVRGGEEISVVPDPRHLRMPPVMRITPSAQARLLGDELFNALFNGQVRSLYDQSLGSLGGNSNRGLRIKLKLDPRDPDVAALGALPWEYLCRTDTQDFLCLSRLSPIVRYLDVPRPVVQIPLPSPLRILMVVSSPTGLEALDLGQERRQLEHTWKKQHTVEIETLEEANVAALREKLLEKSFHVLHFMGHGGFDSHSGRGVLYFEGRDDAPEPLSGEDLATKLKDFRDLQLIVLNACNTARARGEAGGDPFAGVANALVLGGLPAVVAMQFPISDRAAIAFSKAFYTRLATGDPVDAALTEGRQAIHSTFPESLEWGTPVLFMRVPDGRLFSNVAEPSTSGLPQPVATTDPRRLRRAGLGAAIFSLLLFLALAGWLSFEKANQSTLTERPPILEVYQTFDTAVTGLTGAVTSVELLENGRMRLNLEFTNQSEKAQALAIDHRASYVADEFGNLYEIFNAKSGAASAVRSIESIPKGARVTRSLELPAPKDGAKSFSVRLADAQPRQGDLSFFEVKLPAYPEKYTVKTPPPTPPPGAESLPVSVTFASSIEGFIGKVASVDLLDASHMRWAFSFLNRSTSDLDVGLDYSAIYLVDELGNRYPLLRVEAAHKPDATGLLPRALRADYWFEFDAPRDGARKFRVELATKKSSALSFKPFEAQFTAYDAARYSTRSKIQLPPPQPKIASATAPAPPIETVATEPGKEFGSSVPGVGGKVTKIELLPSGRMRWTLSFWNRSNGEVVVAASPGESYLLDRAGNRYSVLSSTTGSSSTSTTRLGAGTRLENHLELGAPRRGAARLTAHLEGHGSETLHFDTFEVDLADFGVSVETATPDKKPGTVVLQPAKTFSSNVEGLSGTLTTIERLEDGRLRLNLELTNATGSRFEIGLRYAATYLSDGRHTYKVLSAEGNVEMAEGNDAWRAVLEPGARSSHWLEISAPGLQARRLTLVLASHDTSRYRFAPFEIDLPENALRP